MKYFDVFAESGFHSAFLTTYALGAQAFEDVVFSRLRGSGCRNIVVLADRKMANQSFAEFGPPKFAGSSYHLIKLVEPGAFHPKITLLCGEKKGRLLVGSANLTALGLGGNKELIASFSYEEGVTESLEHFAAALTYIRRKVPATDLWFKTALQRALDGSPWLGEALSSHPAPRQQAQNAFLHDCSEMTILAQIAAQIGEDPIKRLTVLSPYWDKTLKGLALLRTSLGEPPTDLLMDAASPYFPKAALAGVSGVEIFKAETSESLRFVHAKLMIAQGEHWDHVICGSMNCTVPALLGPTSAKGNAEAGIYKRVPPGTALKVLGLADYADAPLPVADLEELADLDANEQQSEVPLDGGALFLREGVLSWVPPAPSGAGAPRLLQLLDREESPFGPSIDLMQNVEQSWTLDLEAGRPKTGLVHWAAGSFSAPVEILDLDVLCASTLPPARGAQNALMARLTQVPSEELILLELLNQLEALEGAPPKETAGLPSRTLHAPRGGESAPVYTTLSYEEFVRARHSEQAQSPAMSLGGDTQSPASLLSGALNRIIGLMGPDLGAEEDRQITALAAIDLRLSEPAASGEPAPLPAHTEPKPAKAQAAATAQKIKEAVDAFETRCTSLAGKPITTAELVRLRALLQILLAHAQPMKGAVLASQILPVYAAKGGFDWPRLVGRVLKQHFVALRALQNLQVRQEAAEQKRVLEYLALADWAAKAAVIAAQSDLRAAQVQKALEPLAQTVSRQSASILNLLGEEKVYFEQLTAKLDARFADHLALSARP